MVSRRGTGLDIMSKNNHVHKYIAMVLGGRRIIRAKDGSKRIVKKSGYPIFKCTIPGCTHYVPAELALGRESICWVCGKVMVITQRSLRLKRPHHYECYSKESLVEIK